MFDNFLIYSKMCCCQILYTAFFSYKTFSPQKLWNNHNHYLPYNRNRNDINDPHFQVLYTSQQPRQVQIGLNLPSGATVSELRDILESDTSIERANMLITEIGGSGFLRTFTDTQPVSVITEVDPIYCIEVAQLKDVQEESTSAYILLCWINVLVDNNDCQRFGKMLWRISF